MKIIKFKPAKLALAISALMTSQAGHAFSFSPTGDGLNAGTLTDNSQQTSQITTMTTGTRRSITAGLRGLAIARSTAMNDNSSLVGRSAGSESYGITPWASVSYGELDNQVGINDFSTEASSLLIGMDKMLSDNTLLGIALSYDETDSENGFGAWQTTEGYTIAPYYGVVLSNGLLIDVTAGYSTIETDIFTNFGTTPGSTDSERYFAEANINYFTAFGDDVELSLSAGLLWSEEEIDSYVLDGVRLAAATNEITQAKFGVGLTKQSGKFSPFASLSYNYDLDTKASGFTSAGCTGACADITDDKDDFLFAIGSSYNNGDGMTAGVDVQTRIGREYSDEITFGANIRIDM